MATDIYLSLVLPAYNEEHRIIPALTEIYNYIDKNHKPFEIIIVNDGSKDHTLQILEEFKKTHPHLKILSYEHNKGKGYCLRKGMTSAIGKYVFFSDADNATPIQQITAALTILENGNDGVYGVRVEQMNQSSKRRVIGLCFMIIAHFIVFDRTVTDSQCGFKGFTKKSAHDVFSRAFINGGTIDVQIIDLCHRLGYKLKPIAVEWCNVPGSTINLLKCFLQDPWDLFRIRLFRNKILRTNPSRKRLN